jgi:hypothetical protein
MTSSLQGALQIKAMFLIFAKLQSDMLLAYLHREPLIPASGLRAVRYRSTCTWGLGLSPDQIGSVDPFRGTCIHAYRSAELA